MHGRLELPQAAAQLAVRGDAAADGEAVQTGPLQRPLGARDQVGDDRRLVGGGEVGAARSAVCSGPSSRTA